MASDLMKRYVSVKGRYPDCIVLFRNGEQYKFCGGC